MIYSERQSALVDIDRATEFVGDDVDQYSSLIKFDKPYEKFVIEIPTIDNSTVTFYAQQNDVISTVPLPLHYRQASDNATALWATTAGTGGLRMVIDAGLAQFVRIRTASNQTADRTFYVTGLRS